MKKKRRSNAQAVISIVTWVPVSATKADPEDLDTPAASSFLLSSLAVSSISSAAVAPPPVNNSTKTNKYC